MIFTWVLYAVGFSLLLGLAGAAVEWLLGNYRWPLRGLWSLCILFSWLSPLALATMPRLDRTQERPSLSRTEPAVEILPPTHTTRSPSIAETVRSHENRAPDLDLLFFSGWGLTTAFLVTRQGLVLRRISRNQRGRPRSEVDGIEVVRTDEYGPAVLGIFRPRILMPEWTERATGSIRRLALLHEAEHVRCHDTHHLLAGWLPCVVFPWNLPLWWQLKRLRSAIEVDCDRRVLKLGASVAEYGDLLIRVGSRKTASRALVALFESAPEVERRLRLMTTRPPRGLAFRLTGLALIVSGGAAVLAGTPVPEPAVRIQFPQTQGASDSSSVRLIFPRHVQGECVTGCSGEDEAVHLARHGLQPGACSTRVRIMVDRQGRPMDLSIVEEDPDSRCNDAALKWAEATRWDPSTGGGYGVIHPLGAMKSALDARNAPPRLELFQGAPAMDRRTPALLLTAEPAFDFESDIAQWDGLRGYEGYAVLQQGNAADPAVCVLSRASDDRLVLTLLERDEAGDLLADTLSGDAIETRLRALVPGGEPYAAGVLSDGGACFVLVPAFSRSTLPGCVSGCSIWVRESFFRERGLEPGACDVSVRIHLAESGEVTAVDVLRGEPGSACVRVMREWAFSTRWDAAPGDMGRDFVVGMTPPQQARVSSEVVFRLFPARAEGTALHFLLTHPDPEVTLALLLDAYSSGFGRQSLVAEVHARERIVCTVGRAPDGELLLRALPTSGNSALSNVTEAIGPNELARVAANLHPDLEWVAGDVLQEGGTCLLTRPLPPE